MTRGSATGAPSSLDSAPAPASAAWCSEADLYVELVDGRVVRYELPEFVRDAPWEKRRCEVEDFGTAIWWPEIDEGIHVSTIFGVGEDVIYQLAGFEKPPSS